MFLTAVIAFLTPGDCSPGLMTQCCHVDMKKKQRIAERKSGRIYTCSPVPRLHLKQRVKDASPQRVSKAIEPTGDLFPREITSSTMHSFYPSPPHESGENISGGHVWTRDRSYSVKVHYSSKYGLEPESMNAG